MWAVRLCQVEGCGRPHEAKGLCHSHYASYKRHGRRPTKPIPTTPDERFWAKVAKQLDGCWLWKGATNGDGRYGMVGGRGKGLEQAHRVAYEMAHGAIPDGLVIDHLCRTTLCVNPDHLEPVTQAENIMRGVAPTALNARKTHCKRGHEFTPENTYVMTNGGRTCRTCAREATREAQRRYRARKKAQQQG